MNPISNRCVPDPRINLAPSRERGGILRGGIYQTPRPLGRDPGRGEGYGLDLWCETILGQVVVGNQLVLLEIVSFVTIQTENELDSAVQSTVRLDSWSNNSAKYPGVAQNKRLASTQPVNLHAQLLGQVSEYGSKWVRKGVEIGGFGRVLPGFGLIRESRPALNPCDSGPEGRNPCVQAVGPCSNGQESTGKPRPGSVRHPVSRGRKA